MGLTSTIVWASVATLTLLNLYNIQSINEDSFEEVHQELNELGSEIPVVDSRNLFNINVDEDNPEIIQFAQELRESFHNYGFVYLSNHGIPKSLIEDAFRQSRNFFELPQSTKANFSKNRDTLLTRFHGYMAPGQELLHESSVFEVREAFDVVNQERFFPTNELPQFQIAMESMEDACRALSFKLFKIVAMALELEDANYICKASTNLKDKYGDNFSYMGSNYYPPITRKEEERLNEFSNMGQTSRCAEHTDWEVLTLLFQDDAGGLEVKRSDNEWIEAHPIPGTIVVNVGDLLEIWSAGYFPATLHRVVMPSNERRRSRARQSLTFFANSDNDFIVRPLSSPLIPESESHKFIPMTAYDGHVKAISSAYGISM